jgi:hypothetical protein
MAATVKRNLWLYSSAGNVAPARVRGKMAASQGILIPGAPLYLSQDGTFKAADTADGTGDVITHVLDTYLTAEAAANDVVYAHRITTDQLWAVYVENNDSDAAATQTLIGQRHGLRIATGSGKVGYATMDINNTNAHVQVVDIFANLEPSRHTTSTSPGVAVVQFLDAVCNGTRA